jgi:putative thioredoxin
MARKEYAGAASLFSAVLAAEPDNAGALAGLARCQIALGNLAQARGLLDSAPATKANDSDIAGARAALELAEGAAHLGDPKALAAKLAADPADHATRFDLALALNARGDRQGAVRELLEIVRRERSWNEEAARKQLLQFFEAWGPKDPATREGRQRLSSVLFA